MTMIRNNSFFLLAILMAWVNPAKAAYDCLATFQDDIVIERQQVQLIGSEKRWAISPQGDVQGNGKKMALDNTTRKQAIAYQNALRKEVLWMKEGALERLEKAQQALTHVVTETLGKESNVHGRLAALKKQLQTQMDRIIEYRNGALLFHPKVVQEAGVQSERILQKALAGILQDTLRETSIKSKQEDNILLGLVQGIVNLQKSVQTELDNQMKAFQHFGDDVCRQIKTLEEKRKTLIEKLNNPSSVNEKN